MAFQGATPSISSLINQNQFMEEQTQQTLVKAFRALQGQNKIGANSSVQNSTTLATVPDFKFSVKAQFQYLLVADLLWNVYAAAGPVGNLKFQLTAPAHTNNLNAEGQMTYTVSGSASTITQLGTVANSPYASPSVPSVQMFNASLVSANTATAAYSSQATIQAWIQPVVDDVITLQFAQASASNGGPTILQKGSTLNVICMSGARSAPYAV